MASGSRVSICEQPGLKQVFMEQIRAEIQRRGFLLPLLMSDKSHHLKADISRWAHGLMGEASPFSGHPCDLEIGADVPGPSLWDTLGHG